MLKLVKELKNGNRISGHRFRLNDKRKLKNGRTSFFLGKRYVFVTYKKFYHLVVVGMIFKETNEISNHFYIGCSFGN